MTESAQEAFDRGHREGSVQTQLAEHQAHLKAINGSIEKSVETLHHLDLTMNRMNQEFKASLNTVIATAEAAAATVVATAEALRLAEEARRSADTDSRTKSDQSWTPIQRIIAVIGAGGIIYGILISVLH